VRPAELGYVTERTTTTVTVQFRGGVIGKYDIAKNEFTRVNVFPGEDWYGLTIDERIDAVDKNLYTAARSPSRAPCSSREPHDVREWLDGLED
jgi:hypothetical protein